MKIETYLNAMVIATQEYYKKSYDIKYLDRKLRQVRAFRARILRRAAIYRNYAVSNGFDEKQAWFWTDEWQAKEREVDRLIAKGEIYSFDSMDKFLETLEADND